MAILTEDDGSVVVELRIGLLKSCCTVEEAAGKVTHAPSCMDYNGWFNPNSSCAQGNTGHIYFFASDCFISLTSGSPVCYMDFDHVSSGLGLEPWCDGWPFHMCSVWPVGHSSAPHCHDSGF